MVYLFHRRGLKIAAFIFMFLFDAIFYEEYQRESALFPVRRLWQVVKWYLRWEAAAQRQKVSVMVLRRDWRFYLLKLHI